MKLSKVLLSSFLGAMFVAELSPAAVNVISVNFAGDSQTIGASDVAGVVQAANWNNSFGSSGTNQSLVDSNGAATSALLTYVSTDYRESSTFHYNPGFAGFSPLVVPNTSDPDTNQIYRGSLVGWNDDGPHEVTISLTNIPYTKYDVYVYAGTNSPYTGSMNISDGTSSYSYTTPGTEVAPTSLTQDTSAISAYGIYEVFAGRTGSTLTLTTGGGFGYSPNEVFGLQIVAVPEPASLGLLVLGASVTLLRPRRSR